MTTKQLDKLLTANCPAGALFAMRKIRGLPFWAVRVWNEAEFDARGALASWVELQLSAEQDTEDILSDFRHCAHAQKLYNWQAVAV